jgi:30S ribosomal protein S31
MGKGDKKTRRGKIVNKSFGVRRPRPKKKRKISEQKQAQ